MDFEVDNVPVAETLTVLGSCHYNKFLRQSPHKEKRLVWLAVLAVPG